MLEVNGDYAKDDSAEDDRQSGLSSSVCCGALLDTLVRVIEVSPDRMCWLESIRGTRRVIDSAIGATAGFW
jgi:hypothetical protein